MSNHSQPQFNDLSSSDFSRHLRACDKRAGLALARNAGAKPTTGAVLLDDAPDAQAAQLVADFGHTTAAANILLADLEDFSEAFRLLVDALVGVAGDRVGWFSASDKVVAEHAGRSTKWVQKTRAEFVEWQKRKRVAVVDVEDHSYDYADGPKPHKYRVRVARLAAEATLDARASAEWSRHPGKAIEDAARTVRDALPTTPIHKRRKPQRPDDAETLIGRKLRHAETLIKRAHEIQEATGHAVHADADTIEQIEKLLALLKASAEPASSTYKEKVVEFRREARSRAGVSPEWDERDARASWGAAVFAESARELEAEDGQETDTGGVVEESSTTPRPVAVDSTTYASAEEVEPTADGPPGAPETPAETEVDAYARASRELVERKRAAGRPSADAYREAMEEIGEFDDWRARRLRE